MINDYKNEARARWGNTDAYREYETKKKSYIEQKYDAVNVDMKAIFDEFFDCKISGKTVDSAEARALVVKLQAHITANYYTCTDEILAGLARCTLPMNDSGRISTRAARELPSLRLMLLPLMRRKNESIS